MLERLVLFMNLLEDLTLTPTGAVLGFRLHETQRLATPESIEAGAAAMVVELACQASRMGGAAATKAFLNDAFDVRSSPSWRPRMLKSLAPGFDKMARAQTRVAPGVRAAVGALATGELHDVGLAVARAAPELILNPEHM